MSIYYRDIKQDRELLSQPVDLDEIKRALRYPIVQRTFRVFLLHENETIHKDITSYILAEGSIDKNYQQGQTRGVSLNFINANNLWNPSPVRDGLFANSKFKIQIGLIINDTTYWCDEGVFVCQDPSLNNGSSQKTVSIELFDKFALLDGTISGTMEVDYEIPVGTNMYKAIRSLLRLPKDKLGNPYDSQLINFPRKYMNEVIPYTIKKTASNNIGEILIDLGNCISCDVFYDEKGRLTYRDNMDDFDYHNRETVWTYQDDNSEFNEVSRKDEWSKIKNRYIVIGSNINGMECKGVAENINAASPYNINGVFGIRPEVIEDNLIYSNNLCQQRAKYELKKNHMRNTSISFQSICLPHVDPNDLVRWSYQDYGFYNQNFIVDSVSIPLKPSERMSLTITNLEDLPL